MDIKQKKPSNDFVLNFIGVFNKFSPGFQTSLSKTGDIREVLRGKITFQTIFFHFSASSLTCQMIESG